MTQAPAVGRDSAATLLGLLVLPAVVGLLVISRSDVLVWLIALPGMALVVLTRRRLNPIFLSPARLAATALIVVGMLGFAFSGHLARVQGGASFDVALTGEQTSRTAVLLVSAGASVMIGAICLTVLMPSRHTVFQFSQGLTSSAKARSWLLFACIPPLVMAVVDAGGPVIVLVRQVYIARPGGAGTLFGGAGFQLAMAAVLALGYLAAKESGGKRRAATFLLITYGLLFFALGSRRIALFPVLVRLGVFSAVPTRRNGRMIMVAALIGFYLLRLPLFLRYQDSHGLLPYLADLPSFFAQNLSWWVLLKNVLVAFPIVGATAFTSPQIPAADFWTSLNPLPGRFTNWYEIIHSHTLNPYTPYSAIGEIGNAGHHHGYPIVIGSCMILGAVLAVLDRRVAAHFRAQRQMVGLAIVGLCGLFILYLLQYTLRADIRMLYYAIIFDVAVTLYCRRRINSS